MLTVLGHAFAVIQWQRLQQLKYMAPEIREQLRNTHTVMVRRFPHAYVNDALLLQQLRQIVPADGRGEVVVGANVALDLHELITVERGLVHCMTDLKRVDWASTSPNAGWMAKRAYRKHSRRYMTLRDEERKLRTTDIDGTGIAFITFRHPRHAAEFVASHADGKFSQPLLASELEIPGWKVTFAPEPSEILWENLRVNAASRRNRQGLMRLAVVVVLLLGSSFVLVGVFGIGLHYVQLVYNIPMKQTYSGVLDSLLDTLGPVYWAVFVLPLVVFFGILASVPLISKKMLEIECHHTRSKVLESYVRKAFGFYLLINLVLTSCGWLFIVYNADVDSASKARVFADLSGTFHVSLILTECFVMLPLRAYRGWFLVDGVARVERSLTSKLVGGAGMAFNADLAEEEGTVVWIGGIPAEMLESDSRNGDSTAVVWVGGIPAQLLGASSAEGAEFEVVETGEGNISSCEAKTAELGVLLGQYGRVTSMTVRTKAGLNKSWALATFADEPSAKAACAAAAVLATTAGLTEPVQLRLELAEVDTQLRLESTGALGAVWEQAARDGSPKKQGAADGTPRAAADSGFEGSPRAGGRGENAELAKLLARYGRVTSMTVRAKPGVNKSWAFVTFVDAEAAKAACAATLAVHPVDGEPVSLKVMPANVDEQLRKASTGAIAEVWGEHSAARTVELFDFSKQYAELFSLLAMVLAYGPAVPFLFPAGLLYFSLCGQADAHILRSQFGHAAVEDRRVRMISSHVEQAVLAAHLVPVGFVAFHGSPAMLAVLAAVVLCSVSVYGALPSGTPNHPASLLKHSCEYTSPLLVLREVCWYQHARLGVLHELVC